MQDMTVQEAKDFIINHWKENLSRNPDDKKILIENVRTALEENYKMKNVVVEIDKEDPSTLLISFTPQYCVQVTFTFTPNKETEPNTNIDE